jgi:hypothetical protein
MLLDNICACEGLIPSLWTFFETLKYIEPICEALKQLLGSKMQHTIWLSFMSHYFPQNRNMIQLSEYQEAEIKAPLSREMSAWISYVELWAFCGRHFNRLTSFTPRKENGVTKPVVEGPNPVMWQRLARFALSRGFKTARAQELFSADPYVDLARDYIRKANPLSATISNQQLRNIVLAGHTVPEVQHTMHSRGSGHIEKDRRSGRPFEQDLLTDKEMLYFPHLYGGNDFNDTTWTLVRRDMFGSLFGRFNLQVSWYLLE